MFFVSYRTNYRFGGWDLMWEGLGEGVNTRAPSSDLPDGR